MCGEFIRANSVTPPDLPNGPTVSTFHKINSLQYPWLASPEALLTFTFDPKTSLSNVIKKLSIKKFLWKIY